MAEVQPRDILLRVGGRTLQRFGSLAVAGNGQGRFAEVRESFTRASVPRRYRDRDGVGRKAAAGSLAIEYPGQLAGLVDSAGLPFCGPRLDGARNQVLTQPENFADAYWQKVGVPVLTAGQADPFGGTGAFKIDADSGAANQYIQTNAGVYTGDAGKVLLGFLRSDSATRSDFEIFWGSGSPDRGKVQIAWTAGVPSVSSASSGVVHRVTPWSGFAGGWYLVELMVANVVAATSRVRFFPAGDGTAFTGAAFAFGFNGWDALFPGSYQGPGEATGVADALSVPFNFAPLEALTVLGRVARPTHANSTSTALPAGLYFFRVGTTGSPWFGMNFAVATRSLVARVIDLAANDRNVFISIPAGEELALVAQYRNVPTAGQVAADAGAGLSAFSTAADPISKWLNPNLFVGRSGAGDESLFGVLLDLIFVRGLRSRAEMLAIK